MRAQKILKLEVAPQNGVTKSERIFRQRELKAFSERDTRAVSVKERYAALLKRQAREIMLTVSECESAQIAAHMARLRDVEEVIRFAIEHDMVPDTECGRSDRQLLYAATLGDILECLKITRQNHRAPSCVGDSLLSVHFATIERKLDLIAGAIVSDPVLQEKLFGNRKEENL